MSEQPGRLVPTAWQREICKAFDIPPWLLGLGPVPWRVRIWAKVTFARWRGRRSLAREEAGR